MACPPCLLLHTHRSPSPAWMICHHHPASDDLPGALTRKPRSFEDGHGVAACWQVAQLVPSVGPILERTRGHHLTPRVGEGVGPTTPPISVRVVLLHHHARPCQLPRTTRPSFGSPRAATHLAPTTTHTLCIIWCSWARGRRARVAAATAIAACCFTPRDRVVCFRAQGDRIPRWPRRTASLVVAYLEGEVVGAADCFET